MTYCALLALAVLRDEYALLDRAALARMVGACQDADGGCVLSFLLYAATTDMQYIVPHSFVTRSDLRRYPARAMLTCA
jgi:hypothetical protein